MINLICYCLFSLTMKVYNNNGIIMFKHADSYIWAEKGRHRPDDGKQCILWQQGSLGRHRKAGTSGLQEAIHLEVTGVLEEDKE